MAVKACETIRFQFPSNGKAHSEFISSASSFFRIFLFQFPSNGKAHSEAGGASISVVEIGLPGDFNSLQTGRLIQRAEVRVAATLLLREFQFPSNGKAHSEAYHLVPCGPNKTDPAVSFNSLQTGRLIQSFSDMMLSQVSGYLPGVSIPFKREGSFRETPICTQWGRGFVAPKPYTNRAGLFLCLKFALKTPRTLVNTEPYAIFHQN